MKTNSQRTGVSIPIIIGTSRTSPSTDQSLSAEQAGLQKSFHLSHADKIELKKISSPSENKKYATHSQQRMTRQPNKFYSLPAASSSSCFTLAHSCTTFVLLVKG